MSKRLQVILADDEYKEIKELSYSTNKNIAEWVREGLHFFIKFQKPEPKEKRIAKILKYAKYTGPTGNIKSILKEIEKGYLNK
jgi:hypothetical protein